MPKRSKPNPAVENIRRENAIQGEANLIIMELNSQGALHSDLELIGDPIKKREFEGFIIARLQEDFGQDFEDYIDYRLETKPKVPLVRQNAQKEEDWARIRNGLPMLEVKHPWHQLEWQKHVLECFLQKQHQRPKCKI